MTAASAKSGYLIRSASPMLISIAMPASTGFGPLAVPATSGSGPTQISYWEVKVNATTGPAFARGGGDDSAPPASSSGQQIATYAFHHGLPNSLYHVELWAYLALMVFSIVLYSRLRAAEPQGAIAAMIVVAACVVSVAIKIG